MDYSLYYEKYFPFWNELSEADKQYLCENSSLEHFEKEQSVHDNRGCSGLYIVKSGRLRLYMLSDEGKEITLYRLSPGDICMLSASCVLQSITFDVYVDAEMPSDCYLINASAFSAVSERVPLVKIYALETAVSRFSDVMWIMQQIVFMSMDKRLAISLNTIRVGMLATLYCTARVLLSSTFTLPTVMSVHSSAISSTIGDTILQGPHQSA